MRLSLLHTLLVLSVTSVGSSLRHRDESSANAGNGTAVIPKRYIIELDKTTDVDAVASELASRKGARVLKTFKSDVFSGLSVEATNDNIDTFQALDSVSRAWYSNKIRLAPHIPTQSYSDDASSSLYTVHNWTGVDKLHAAGITGKGAVVAIVDTGTWYKHPDLGGGFGPGFKVAGGYDFVGDGTWPFGGEKDPDSDPLDQIGHGTHVAGIVAAKGENFVGVAPDATLLSYKVFGSEDGTDEDTLIEAFLAAYDAEADVITCSVGGDEGWADNAWAVVASRLVEQGVVVTIAAGNSGQEGPFYGSNGATGEFVLAVASVEASTWVSLAFYATFNLNGQSNTTEVAYLPGWDVAFPADVAGWPIVPLSLNTSIADDACDTLPADTPDLSHVIALVRKGGCGYDVKQANLEAHGAKYILFYNDDKDALDVPWSFYQDKSNLGLIESKAGVAIIDTVADNGNVTADFSLDPNTNYYGMYNSAGGTANFFTSWGGLNDLTLKPDVAAPGGNIFSTYLDGNYAVMSGTSMATPYIAGIAALYIGQFGGRKVQGAGFAKNLVMRIIASGRSIPWRDGETQTDYGFWAPPIQVGTGLIDAPRVLEYSTSLSFAKFSLNDTHHFSRYREVDITNNGNETLSYRFDLQDAAGFEDWAPASSDIGNTPRFKMYWADEFSPVKLVPSVSFPTGSFIVKPGETKKAKFSFLYPNYPNGLENVPIYSGKVLISSSSGEHLSIPYFGVASDLKALLAKENFRPGYPFAHSGWSYPFYDLSEKSNFTFNLTVYSQDYPKLYARTNWAAKELRWDIFEENWVERDWKYPPVVGENKYVGSVATWANSDQGYYYFDPATDNDNLTISFPRTNLPRSALDSYDQQYWWFGRLANGSQIAVGNYVMRFAVLSPFGTPSHADNWDASTHSFEVLPLVPLE